MKVRLRLLGALAEAAGVPEEVLDLAPGATVADAIVHVADRHPAAASLLPRISPAVNHEVVSERRVLKEDDELALLPPVAGGANIVVGLRDRPTVDEASAAVAAPEAGGTVVFLGTVRDRSEIGPVTHLEYSAYEEMTERILKQVAQEAADRWSLEGVAILHGVGEIQVRDATVVIACSAAHRGEAFAACRYVIDEVKRRAPIWKKERGPTGERWVGLEESP